MADLAGFDFCYALGAGGLGQALQSQLQPLAVNNLRGITLALPDVPQATLDVEHVSVSPTATIQGASQTVSLTVTGSADLRMGVNAQGLVTLPVVGSLPAGIASLPMALTVPSIQCALTVSITRTSSPPQVRLDAAPGAAVVTTPGYPPAGLASTIETGLTTRLNALLAGTGNTIQTSRVRATATALAAAIQPEIVRLVALRLEGLFPVPINFAIPPVDPAVFCGIGLRTVAVRLLDGRPASAGSPATDPCLAIATTLLSSSTGNESALVSPLPSGQRAGLFFDNFFLVQTVCCALEAAPQFRGLTGHSAPMRGADPLCCGWAGVNVPTTMGGRAFTLHDASVCIDSTDPANKTFMLHMELTTSDVAWDARVTVDIPVRLGIAGGAVVPIVGTPTINVAVSLAWWVIVLEVLLVVILAIISAAIGGALGWIAGVIAAAIGASVSLTVAAIVGAGIAAVLGIIVGIVIAIAINSAINNSVQQSLGAAASALSGGLSALRVIPQELQDVFGRLEAAAVHFDDVAVFGRPVIPPASSDWALLAPSEIVVPRGSGIDLDTGAIVAPTHPGCDLDWCVPNFAGRRPLLLRRGLEATWAAAMVPVTGVSYAALRLAAVRALPFPLRGGSASAAAVPVDDEQPLQPLVFGARTGEGRFAKCAAWQDLSGALHLRYTLWNTPARLRIDQRWTAVRGAMVPSPVALQTTYEVARTGTFQAVPVSLHAPVAYRWLWDGHELHDGDRDVAGGISSVSINGGTCVLRTASGQPLEGELCLDATDRYGVRADVCRHVDVAGTDTEFERVPLQPPHRSHDWLAEWLARHGWEDPDWGRFDQRLPEVLQEDVIVRQFAPLAEQIDARLEQVAQVKRGGG